MSQRHTAAMPVELVTPASAPAATNATAAPATNIAPVAATPSPTSQAVPQTSQSVDVVAPTISAKVPDKYELKLPEKSVVSDKDMESVSALAKDLGITTNEAAQKILEYRNASATADREKSKSDYEASAVQWLEKTKAEHGPNFDAAVKAGQNFMNWVGDQELKDIFNEFRLGDHPAFVRAFAKAGKTMAEGRVLSGEPISAKPAAPKSLADVLYDKPSATGTR
jgi:hypothetical protein